MISDIRAQFNREFSTEKYQKSLEEVKRRYNHVPAFRIAETPVFIPENLKGKLLDACHQISEFICRPDFKELSRPGIPPGQFVPNEDEHTTFLQMDFAICKDENGELDPQLIEVQGFPSLYLYQDFIAWLYRKSYSEASEGFTHLLGGMKSEEYLGLLRDVIVGDCDPKNVILLEIEPFEQVTQIVFMSRQQVTAIQVTYTSLLRNN